MAILVLSSRNFASLLREACNPNELKIKRLIERSMAKKNEHNTLRINLTEDDLKALNMMVYEHDFMERGLEETDLALSLDQYAMDEDNANEGTPPYIAYSLSEWKAIVEIATGQTSSIDLTALDAHLLTVQYDLEKIYTQVRPIVLEMIRRGYDVAPQLILPPGVKPNDAPVQLILPPGV